MRTRVRNGVVKLAKLNAGILAGGGAYAYYAYPELRQNPVQLAHATQRGFRLAYTASMIGVDYLSAGENITSEVHLTAATRLFHCFCQNGGPYIKLG